MTATDTSAGSAADVLDGIAFIAVTWASISPDGSY